MTHQHVVIIDGSDVRFELTPEELPKVLVVPQVLHLCLIQPAAKHPNVETEQGATEEDGQLDLIEPAPQPGDGFEGHLAVKRDLQHQGHQGDADVPVGAYM